MSPLEALLREVCRELGADPNSWQGFEGIGRVAVSALCTALPERLAAEVLEFMKLEG